MNTDSWKHLWAKSSPPHQLWQHLLDTAAVSLALRNPLSSDGWSTDQLALIVALHDIGKADYCFQSQDADLWKRVEQEGFARTQDARCRHERLSSRFIRKRIEADGLPPDTASAITRAVVAHHGHWNESARDVHDTYAQAQNDLYGMLKKVLAVGGLPNKTCQDWSAFGMRLAGHIVLCDWIASYEKFFTDPRLAGCEDPTCYFGRAKEVACDLVKSLSLDRTSGKGNAAGIVNSPRPIQKAILESDTPPGLVIIEAPMGEGKTEAAWILAEKWRDLGYHGIYMALPTMATSDSLHGRYLDDYLKRLGRGEDTKLVHGMAWLRDENEPEKPPEVGEPGDDRSMAAAWFRPTRRAMLAAHGVGTVDQAMLAGMHVKFGFLRLFGLADRVLVIDEVHAYDAYMSAIIARLLQWCACLRIPVVMLSATLSARQRTAMLEAYGSTGGDLGPDAPYPLITYAVPGQDARTLHAKASESRTLKVVPKPGLLGDAKKTAKLGSDLVKCGGCCCVIVNTVKQAQAVFGELRNTPEDQKLLFHARFTAADRQRIAERVLELFGKDTAKRPERFILVATQVVEQSLDVDFNHMISEIAPMDLLLQRSGRLHRHRRREGNPVLHVLVPDGTKERKARSGKKVEGPPFGASEFIYQRYPLLTTLNQLSRQQNATFIDIGLPGAFRGLIESTYADTLPNGASEDLKEAKAEWDDLQEDLAAQAGEFLLCEPMADEFDPVGADEVGDESDDGNGWRARTRLGLEDVLVIPVLNDDAEQLARGELTRDQVRDLYLQSLKVPAHHWPLGPLSGLTEADRKRREPHLGKNKLKGVWLLPVEGSAEKWSWSGERQVRRNTKVEWHPIELAYHKDTGLQEVEKKKEKKEREASE